MRFLVCLFFTITWVSVSNAITIASINADHILLELENETLKLGDRLIAYDANGKAKAILKVTQIKDQQATVVIVKGQVEINHRLTKWVPAQKSTTSSTAKGPIRTTSSWGVTAGTTSNSMTVKPGGSAAASLTGSSINASAFYQRDIDGAISTRILAGYHSFQAAGTSTEISTCALGECKVDISYLGLEALVRYSFLKNKNLDIWAGAGLGFLYALGKESNVIDTTKITANQTILLSFGLDWNLNNKSFIPVQFDYAQHPDNATSSANQTTLRLGYGRWF